MAIADVGTGSGIIAICAALFLPAPHVTALDLSPAALAVARANIQRHGVSDRVQLVESDLLAALPAERKLDFVLSNPPYISESEYAVLPRDVREFEPRLALVGGPQGTEVIARLIPQAAERLIAGGWLLMEISPMIQRAVCELLRADGRFAEVETVKDLSQLPRIVKARRIA